MAEVNSAENQWLAVIGKALAYLCLQEAQKKEPEKFDTVLKRVKFLQALGLSQRDAAHAVGSSAASVQVLHSQAKSKKGGNNARAKKKSRR